MEHAYSPLVPPPLCRRSVCFVGPALRGLDVLRHGASTPGDPGSGSGAWPLPGLGAGAGSVTQVGSSLAILSGGEPRARPGSGVQDAERPFSVFPGPQLAAARRLWGA